MLQEIIPGPTRNLYHLRGYFSRDGRPIVLLASHKLRQPTMFSDNTALVSIPLRDLSDGVSIITRYFQNIQYTGLFGADFKRDPRDGQLKLLEINARSQGGNYFSVVCNANHVLAAYQDSLGEPVQPIPNYRVGTYYVGLVTDLLAFLNLLVQGRVTREDVTPYLRHPHWNFFSRHDLAPFLHRIWGMVRNARG
jgi:predicted ATP-grasp superfamily ATP-dependent carboligase